MLPNGEWLLEKCDEGDDVFPVWADKSEAADYAQDDELRPAAISLEEWRRDWVPELTENRERVSIRPEAGVPLEIVDAAMVIGGEAASAGLAKVLFRGPSETAWAQPLGEGVYELANSPFFVEYSWHDRVRCEQGADGQLEVVELVRPSGHVTLRALLDPLVDASAKDALLKRITELGGSYEGAEAFYFAIDLPPGVDRRPIEELLRAHEDDVIWEEGMSESFRETALAAVDGVGRTAEHAAPLGDEEAEDSLLVDIEAVDTTTRHYERLFATAIGDELRVLNAPFFAYGLAYGDRVAVQRRAGRAPLLREVTRPSGHYTARAILEDDRFEPALRAAVREVSGRFERLAGTQMIAIDIPGADETKRLRTRLDAMEAEGKLGYETGW